MLYKSFFRHHSFQHSFSTHLITTLPSLLIILFLFLTISGVHNFHHIIAIGVNAHVRRDGHCLPTYVLRTHTLNVDQSSGGSDGIIRSAPHAEDAIVALQYVAVAGNFQRNGLIGDQEGRLQPAQVLVGPPTLGQLDAAPRELAGMLVQLALQAFQEGEGIGRAAGEAHDGPALLVLVSLLPGWSVGRRRFGEDSPDLLGVGLDDDRAHGHLSISHHAHLAILAHTEDCGTVPFRRRGGGRGTVGASGGACHRRRTDR
mmetsp:Transcript_6671/g.11132  ORF Transcript_6671/g.11132 Transcript_6671/m.11132 type:complete len:258 (+) Transcript_6671:346-1119(+)